MILVTVGTQLPFDRLIRAVDAIIPASGERAVAQIGKGTFQPANMEWHANLDSTSFSALLQDARVVVAHAGIGTLLMAQKHHKPLIIFPRRASLKEHRNDHQMATAEALKARAGVYVAWTEADLATLLGRAELAPPPSQTNYPERDRLNAALTSFIGRA